MGHSPPRPIPAGHRPPNAADFWIGVAKSAYVQGTITLDEFEVEVDALLAGGSFPGRFLPQGLPAPRDPGKREMR